MTARRARLTRVVLLAALAVCLSLVAGLLVGSRLDRTTQASPVESSGSLVGVFRGTDRQQVEEFASWLGRPLEVVMDFSARDSWEQISRPTYMLEEWEDSGMRPVYGVAMLPVEDSSATMSRGAAGEYDGYFRTLAEELVAAGQADAALRIGWEFNLAGSRWSTPESQQFVDYWRNIVEVMRSVEGSRFSFDWNVNNGDGNAYDATTYYPGDDVVDVIGVDVYDQSGRPGTYPYPDPCDGACRLARQQAAWQEQVLGGERGLQFWSSFAAEHGKPLSLPEWGLWQRPDGTGGGENPFFIERMHDFIEDPSNNVLYHGYFENDGDDGQHTLRTAFPASGLTFRYLWTRS